MFNNEFSAFENGVVLEKALHFKPLVLIGVIVLLLASMVLSLSKGFTFMDMSMEADQMTVTVGPKEDEKLTFEELTAMLEE